MGTTGLETAFAAVYTDLVDPGRPAARADRAEAERGRRADGPADAGDRGRQARRPGADRPRRRRGRSARPATSRARRTAASPAAPSTAGCITTIAAGGIVYRERTLTAVMSAYVLLEDGTRFDGEAVGAHGSVTGEVVFTTGMSGYQESMTDPSFARQLITFTTAHVGNYGVSEAAMESDRIHAAGRDHARGGRLRRRARRRAGLAELAARATASRASRASTRARWSATSAPRAACAAGSSPPTSRSPRRASASTPSRAWSAATSPAR